MKDKIVEILKKELDYSEYVANVTANNLVSISPQLQPVLAKWVDTREMTNVEVLGFSIKQLMERDYTFPSALISMNWLLTDPETAKKELYEDDWL